MGKRTRYAPGAFCWVDLTTTDAGEAKSFYERLFGWEMADNETGDGTVYTTCLIDGDAICGLHEPSEQRRSDGTQSSWMSYVSVEAADAAAERAQALGGEVIQSPFDVLDSGRVAVLEDPEGAIVAVWEARARIGADRVNDIGCLCMNELATTGIDAAREFYERLFGWTTEPIDAGPDGPLALGYNGETLNAGFYGVRPGARSHWRPVFTVDSTATAVDGVAELGGTSLSGALELPDGSLATVSDPQGAVFGLFAGEVDP